MAKVSFNGTTKEISVLPGVTALDITADVYSEWVRWVPTAQNFLPAMRYSGLDTIPSGRTGAIYFLINDWKLLVDLKQTRVTGVLYSEDYESAYFDLDTGSSLFPASVTSVVNTVYSGGSAAPTLSEIWTYGTRTLTAGSGSGPTAVEIRQEIDTNSVKLTQIKAILDSMDVPTAVENANAVWVKPISELTDKTTIGGYISRVLLSIPKFLGLK